MWAENKAGGRSLKTYTEKVKHQPASYNVLKCFKMFKKLHGKGKTPPSHTSLSQCFEFSDMWQKDHFGRPQVVTHLEGEKRTKPSEPESPPELPNIRSCCVKNNVTHASCVDRFVDVCAFSWIVKVSHMSSVQQPIVHILKLSLYHPFSIL